jgi:hypothetical protein
MESGVCCLLVRIEYRVMYGRLRRVYTNSGMALIGLLKLEEMGAVD